MTRWSLRLFPLVLVALAFALAPACSVSTEPPSDEELREVELAAGSTPPMSREEIMALGSTVVGYSYWWGHGRWETGSKKFPGHCSGGCPSCKHWASKGGSEYGADCSGFVAQAWQVPTKGAVNVDRHPYSTKNFRYEKIHWYPIKKSELKKGDALVYNSGGKGHIVLFESWSKGGKAVVYECAGCSTGCVHRTRSIGSSYIAIRRKNLTEKPEQDAGAQDAAPTKDAGTGGSSGGSGGSGSGGSGGGTAGTGGKGSGGSGSGSGSGGSGSGSGGSGSGSGGSGSGSGGSGSGSGGSAGSGGSTPVSNTPCTQLAMSSGWKSVQCQTSGSTVKCGDHGVKTPDCDKCCGSSCQLHSECPSGTVCTWDGAIKCCQAKGAQGTKCVHDSQCSGGQVCLFNGDGWVCATPKCVQ